MTETSRFASSAAAYIGALESFGASTMDDFLSLCAHDIEFRDPFNHTRTRDDFQRVLEHMLKQVKGLRFEILQHWQKDNSLVLKWRFTGEARFIGRLDIPSLSEVAFNDEGRCSRHIDYWDANEHITSKLPGIGPLVRLAMRPMSI